MPIKILSNKAALAVVFSGGLILASFLVTAALAEVPPGVTFPIAELGGCQSEADCKTYCDQPANFEACIDFAEDHNLVSAEEADRARRLTEFDVGPGGCTSHDQCEDYCEDISNIEECIAFAEEHDVLTDEELDEARRIAAAVKAGVSMPGGCTNEDECRSYCEDPSHLEECITFGIAAGFMDPSEAEEIRRIGRIIMDDGPGGCTSKTQCDAYCDDPAHTDECVAFALEHGFMSPEEAEMMRKTGGKGPGGCVREECETYCDDPAHQDECFEFGMKYGLIPEEDLARMKEGVREFEQMIDNAPPEVARCIKEKVGDEKIRRIIAGEEFPSPAMWETVPRCFEEHGGFGGPVDGPGGDFRPSPEVERCIENALGPELFSKFKSGDKSPEMMKKAEHCLEEFGYDDRGPDGRREGEDPGWFRGDPPEVENCLRGVLSDDEFAQMKAGGWTENPANYERVRHCFGDTAPAPGPPPEYRDAYDEFRDDAEEFRHEFEGQYEEFIDDTGHPEGPYPDGSYEGPYDGPYDEDPYDEFYGEPYYDDQYGGPDDYQGPPPDEQYDGPPPDNYYDGPPPDGSYDEPPMDEPPMDEPPPDDGTQARLGGGALGMILGALLSLMGL